MFLEAHPAVADGWASCAIKGGRPHTCCGNAQRSTLTTNAGVGDTVRRGFPLQQRARVRPVTSGGVIKSARDRFPLPGPANQRGWVTSQSHVLVYLSGSPASPAVQEDAMASQSRNRNRAIEPDPDQQLVRNLGWFSIGLGAAEILAPGLIPRISCALDSNRSRTVIRTYGAREIAQGIAILSSMPRPAGWVWGCVAGDVLDIGSVATGMLTRGGDVPWGVMAITSLLGVTHRSRRLRRARDRRPRPLRVPLVERKAEFARILAYSPSIARHGTGDRSLRPLRIEFVSDRAETKPIERHPCGNDAARQQATRASTSTGIIDNRTCLTEIREHATVI